MAVAPDRCWMLDLRPEQVAAQGLRRAASERLPEKRYVAAGERAYVVGVASGDFPPIGWHVSGEMGGVWAHPIRLLRGYWFFVQGTPLDQSTRFTAESGSVRFDYAPTGDLVVTRREFSPDSVAAVLVGVTVLNRGKAACDVTVGFEVRSGMMCGYPWDRGTIPTAEQMRGLDHGSFESALGRLVFGHVGTGWTCMIGASMPAAGGGVGAEIRGEANYDPASQSSPGDRGIGGRLDWIIPVEAGKSATLWVAIAGSHRSAEHAEKDLLEALRDPDGLLRLKIAGREELLRRSEARLPDRDIEAAFQWSKFNLADLRRTVTDVQIRATSLGKQYPPPVSTLAKISGVGAGLPDYAWFFGTDGAYTMYALVASGQWDMARDHLRLLRHVSACVNGDSGKIIHEVTTDGAVFLGLNEDPGDTNETAQFAIAVHLFWRWSGEDAFLKEMFPCMHQGLKFLCELADRGGTGWPTGWGMVERAGMGSSTIDVAAYTLVALTSFAEMAAYLEEGETEAWAVSRANALKERFETDWWVEEAGLYADSLCGRDDVTEVAGCDEPGSKLLQRHWTGAVPMEMGISELGHAAVALRRMEESDFNSEWGLYHTARNSDSGDELAVWTLPNSVMAMAELNYGRADGALRYVRAIARLLDLEMPGALPEIAPSPAYDAFQPLTKRAMFMQAWSAYGIQWPIVNGFLGVEVDAPHASVTVIPNLPREWPDAAVDRLRAGDLTLSVEASHGKSGCATVVSGVAEGWQLTIGHILPKDSCPQSVTLNGSTVPFECLDTKRGREVRVSVNGSTGSQRLAVEHAACHE